MCTKGPRALAELTDKWKVTYTTMEQNLNFTYTLKGSEALVQNRKEILGLWWRAQRKLAAKVANSTLEGP